MKTESSMIIRCNWFHLLLILFLLQGCTQEEEIKDLLFQKLDSTDTGIDFENNLTPTEEFNMYIFRNFYNGGGVAVGDVSGNGLPDIFLTGNMVSNRLYLNKGDYRFEDHTEEAGLLSDGVWSTGASMVDINGNGLLDIFVTKSGPPEGENRHNQLFINNGDLTFTDKSKEYGLDDIGLSTHAVFFDYNGNGRMDMYLVSNSFHSVLDIGDVTAEQRQIPDPEGASKLYRNDGDRFTDVTQEAGVYSSVIGFGLSATVADINRNGLPDLYVANDFFERDYLYINNGDGTFTESLEDHIRSISHSSMGSDIADINNDGWPDIYVSDMLPYNEERLKSKMTFETWDEYQENADRGFHHKYTRNTLQLNQNGADFLEIGRYSGVEATDWSWAVLMADFNHNGFNDIFVANGIYKDLLDQDYIHIVSDPRYIADRIRNGEEEVIMSLMEEMTSEPLRNFLFANKGMLQFEDKTKEWGLDTPGFSSSAAWADLNGDGALDMIINNVNGPAWIYRNRTSELYPDTNWLRVDLKGEAPNTFGIGAQLQVWANGQHWYREHILQRGFQSSVEPGLHAGFGEISRIDSLVLRWPDGRTSRVRNLELPARIELDQTEADFQPAPEPALARMPGDKDVFEPTPLFEDISDRINLDWKHSAYEHVDFNRERLMFHKRSTEGPALCSGDVTGNGLEDFYIGGARNQPGALFIQDESGRFTKHLEDLFLDDTRPEETDCLFFDANGNGADDLYIVSGGNSYSSTSSALADRLYLNNGSGSLTKSNQILPSTRRFESGSVVKAYDFTGDGNQDLFVGTRLQTFAVGMPVSGYLLAGDGTGHFDDVTDQWAPDLRDIGMITDALWVDLNGNNLKELVIAGEWMPIRVFQNDGERFSETTEAFGLLESTGWWNTLTTADITGNGLPDLVAGNHGENSFFKADGENNVKMWVGDFNENGLVEQIIATNRGNYDYPVAHRRDMIAELPHLEEWFPDHQSYAGTTIHQIFDEEQLNRALYFEAENLSSTLFLNQGNEGFEQKKLPVRTQMAPIFGLEVLSYPGTSQPLILMTGNLYGVKPEVGSYDAGRGSVVLYGENTGEFLTLSPKQSGFHVIGEGRKIRTIRHADGTRLVIVARYDREPQIFSVRD